MKMNPVQVIVSVISVAAIILAGLIFSGFINITPEKNPVTAPPILTIWGTENPDIFQEAFSQYLDATETTIVYIKKEAKTFSDEIIRALARNEGPDLLIADSQWIAINKDLLSPVPAQYATTRDFENMFIGAASRPFYGPNETIYAFPLWIDPLVLYWNKDLFNAKGIPNPPKNWSELLLASNDLKIIGDAGSVVRSGVALGRANNIPLHKEILTLILLQLGGDIEDSNRNFLFDSPTVSQERIGESALRFYTDFARASLPTKYTWNHSLREPRELFSEGKLGMMIDYLSYAPVLRAKNPHLSFDITFVPQRENAELPIYYGSIEGIAVPRGSKNTVAGWYFARILVSPKFGYTKKVLTAKNLAPAQRDLLADTELAKNPLFGILKNSSLNLRYPRDTHPIPNAIVIREMTDAAADGRMTPSEALSQAQGKRNKIER